MADPDLRPRILAIDDTPANLQVLVAALVNDFRLQVATSGSIGLAAATRTPPDLILLDVMMPEMDGFEVCRRLKADPVLQSIPVIFLTANSDAPSEELGLKLGAVDYITKPIKVGLARLRIGNLMEREALRKEITQQRNDLSQMVDQLKQAAQHLQAARLRELEIGNTIQRNLLQGELPNDIEGVCLSSLSEPSQGVDGDFSLIHCLQKDCFDVLVGDVMGKGVPAALTGAAIRTTYHQALSELLVAGSCSQSLPTPAQIVNQMHRALTPRLTALESFATLALYRFNLAKGLLHYVNAGHTQGLLLGATQSQAALLLGDNLPIGIMATEVYTQSEVRVVPGDIFLLFSDGITEARDANGEEFGLARLSRLLESCARDGSESCQDKIDSISQALNRFGAGAHVSDDQTLLMVELLVGKTHCQLTGN